jgi:hypothetical protein
LLLLENRGNLFLSSKEKESKLGCHHYQPSHSLKGSRSLCPFRSKNDLCQGWPWTTSKYKDLGKEVMSLVEFLKKEEEREEKKSHQP